VEIFKTKLRCLKLADVDHNFEWVAKKNGNDLAQINRKAPLSAWGFGWSKANLLVKRKNSLETVCNQRFWIICL